MNTNLETMALAAFWRAAATRLREARELHGWEQDELARRAGVPLGVVAHYELDEMHHTSLDNWRRLTAALGFDLPAFLLCAEEHAGVPIPEEVLAMLVPQEQSRTV